MTPGQNLAMTQAEIFIPESFSTFAFSKSYTCTDLSSFSYEKK